MRSFRSFTAVWMTMAAIGGSGCNGVSLDGLLPARIVDVHAAIRTEGGDTKKMSMMRINASPLSALRTSMSDLVAGRRERLRILEAEKRDVLLGIDGMERGIGDLKAELVRKESAVIRARNAALAAADRGKPTRSIVDDIDREEAAKRTVDAAFEGESERLEPLRDTIRDAKEELDRALKTIKHLDEEVEAVLRVDFFGNLPQPAKTWLTDAEGRQQLRLPLAETWVVWASDSRRVGSEEEEYRWLFRVPEDVESDSKLMFHGSNQAMNRVPPWMEVLRRP